MDAWQAAAIALAIGFLIGAERERDGGPAGVRTFALAGLAGAGAALVHPVVLGFAVTGGAVIMAAGYLRPALPRVFGATEATDAGAEGAPSTGTPHVRLSTASSIALVLTVLLGGLAVTQPALAAGAGVATAAILLAKERLHSVIRNKITELELTDALKFFVAALIVLPLMPHANLGPYGVVDPRRMWTFVVAVTALGWLGYVAVRLAGPERGLPAAGLAGGFVSSAATTGSMARTSRDPAFFRPAMAAALLATVASLVQLVLVTAVADTRVAWLLVPATALGAVVLIAEAAWLLVHKPGTPLFGRFASQRRRRSGIARQFQQRLRRRDGWPSRRQVDRTAGDPADADRTAADPADADRTAADPADADRTAADPADRARSGPKTSAATARMPARTSGGTVVLDGGTVTAIDFGAPSSVDDRAESTVDRPDADPPEHGRTPRALAGRRPFELIPALLLTGILAVFLVISAVVEHTLGPGAAVIAIAVAGLADSHAGGLTAANLASQAALTPQTAALATVAAVAANTVVKLILAHVAGGRRASTTLAVLFVVPAIAVTLGLVVTLTVTG